MTDLQFSVSGPSRNYTPAARHSDNTRSSQTDQMIVEVEGPLLGLATDAAVPDITAGGAIFTFFGLYKGMVANLLAIKNAMIKGQQISAQSNSVVFASDATQAPPRPLTFTHNEQTLSANGTYSMSLNAAIKYADIEVIGSGAIRYSADGTPASATHGKVLAGASSSPGQGGGFTYESAAVPQALTFFALGATVVCITTGV